MQHKQGNTQRRSTAAVLTLLDGKQGQKGTGMPPSMPPSALLSQCRNQKQMLAGFQDDSLDPRVIASC